MLQNNLPVGSHLLAFIPCLSHFVGRWKPGTLQFGSAKTYEIKTSLELAQKISFPIILSGVSGQVVI